ncbi:MAG: aminopeptidase P family protein [Spirulinaceae cyanobacterium SM2_1_0]|nr:aminopeptidase P family protein [Spirulinaceae cyanobacterium SM2_1_0]
MLLSPLPLAALQHRRQKLAAEFDRPVVLWAGRAPARNFVANRYPFRASSHFLYFAGRAIEDAVVWLEQGKLTLYVDEPSPASVLWHGPTPSRDDLAAQIGARVAYPLAELPTVSPAATLGLPDDRVRQQQSRVLQRQVLPAAKSQGRDRLLAAAIIQLRLQHDEAAIAELRQAATASIAAHQAGLQAAACAQTEAEIRAAMEAEILARDRTCAYPSIVTVAGEVLHNDQYHRAIAATDLILADVGAESAGGWAADITRTFPARGQFSPTQRQIYELVLAAHDACIAAIRPGVEYRDIHLLAAQAIATGLVELGILCGEPEALVARDAHALFFPHGVGHLLGLDVHDMEDLGDLAGYAPGRQRSDRFGLAYLRLDRPLAAGMAVTIEPGFYQVPAILNDPARREQFADCVNWERLAQFADVRGIRIEDDVLVTATGAEVLTAALPTTATAIEALVQAGKAV